MKTKSKAVKKASKKKAKKRDPLATGAALDMADAIRMRSYR